MVKKKILRALSLKAVYKKGFKQGSAFWKFGFYIAIIFKVIKWLLAKPSPSRLDEYELSPGEYKVIVTDQSEKISHGKSK